MNLTYEEQERLAYISGDTQKAGLLAEMLDMKEENDELYEENTTSRYQFWCPECGFED